MFLDGASSSLTARKKDAQHNRAGMGILFVFSDNALIPYSFSLTKGCVNNTAEIEVVIVGLELALRYQLPTPLGRLRAYQTTTWRI